MGSDWGYLRLPDKRFLFVSCFRDPRVCMSIDSITFAHPCSGLSENIPRFKAKITHLTGTYRVRVLCAYIEYTYRLDTFHRAECNMQTSPQK